MYTSTCRIGVDAEAWRAGRGRVAGSVAQAGFASARHSAELCGAGAADFAAHSERAHRARRGRPASPGRLRRRNARAASHHQDAHAPATGSALISYTPTLPVAHMAHAPSTSSSSASCQNSQPGDSHALGFATAPTPMPTPLDNANASKHRRYYYDVHSFEHYSTRHKRTLDELVCMYVYSNVYECEHMCLQVAEWG